MLYFFSQYVTQTVEVESPATLKHLTKARQRNELLSAKLSNQNEQCKQLEEQIRKSDEHSCNLQHKVTKSNRWKLAFKTHKYRHEYTAMHVCRQSYVNMQYKIIKKEKNMWS